MTSADWNDYNWAPARPGDAWRSFETIFEPFYDWAQTRGSPSSSGNTAPKKAAEARRRDR